MPLSFLPSLPGPLVRRFASIFSFSVGLAIPTIAAGQEEPAFQAIHVDKGTLYFEDGTEVALWGVNFQTAMSWEFNRFRKSGLMKTLDLRTWKVMTDRSLDEIQLMDCDLIRIHLGTADFTDAKGNLVENEWLEMLDYTMAECRKRGIYVNLAFLNSLGRWRDDSFVGSPPRQQNKWEWITVPEQIKATERYIRQLVNRKNPYDGNRRYKENPAWVVAEFINEPMFPKALPTDGTGSAGIRVYEKWLKREGRTDSSESFSTFKYLSIKQYINRLYDLLKEENVAALPCWNLYWVKGPEHEGKESFDAAADSKIELVSFATYPGQGDTQKFRRENNGRSPDNTKNNYLPYLKSAYEKPTWQAWLQDDRFKGKKARIVYEWEAWNNYSSYIYPAIGQYFRAQGAQMATMWTYSLYGLAAKLGPDQSHNLNLRTTPQKTAAFLAAGEIFRHTPRFAPFILDDEQSTYAENYAFSHESDYGVYFDPQQVVYSGNLVASQLELPEAPVRIVGAGSSPYMDYAGNALVSLERKVAASNEIWALSILPHTQWDEARERWMLDSTTPHRIRLSLPGIFNSTTLYRRSSTGDLTKVLETDSSQSIYFDAVPGTYLLERSL